MIDNTPPRSAPSELEAAIFSLDKALSPEEQFKQILTSMAAHAADGITRKKGSGATFYSAIGPLTVKMDISIIKAPEAGTSGGVS